MREGLRRSVCVNGDRVTERRGTDGKRTPGIAQRDRRGSLNRARAAALIKKQRFALATKLHV